MALQGTLDTFELPDVLRLLASTRKAGRLHLSSDRGDGDVWMADGAVVALAAPGASRPADDLPEGLFELLRAREGSFVFEPGDEPATAQPPADVEPLLATAERQLAEWREIEAVVPSLASWLALAPELPGPTATVDAATWRLVAAIGSGLTVGELGEQLDLAEVPVSGLVRDLVEMGLAEIGPAPAHAAPAPAPSFVAPEAPAAADEPAPVFATPAHEPVTAPAYEPTYDTVSEPKAPLFTPAEAPIYADPIPAEAMAPAPAADDDLARGLAMLSPRAAQAVAAASPAFADEPARAEGDDTETDEEPNRGALLRFLGSVNT